MTKKLNIEDFKQIAKDRNGFCLSDNYVNNHTHLKWQCEHGHIWSAVPKMIKKGTWCPHCYNKTENRRKAKHIDKLDEVKKTAVKKGGVCLSKKYINNRSNLKFRCKEGHEWETNWKTINKGAWCPTCQQLNSKLLLNGKINPNYSGKTNKFYDELVSLSQQRGGKLLDTKYLGQHIKLHFECSMGHKFKKKPNNVKFGGWCPECNSSISERICRLYFEEIFKCEFTKQRPKWLKNKTGFLMELDGFNEDLGVAFEHQGIQHYEQTNFGKLEQIQKRDFLKKEICQNNNVVLIEIPALFIKTKLKDLDKIIYDKLNSFDIQYIKPNKFPNINIAYNEKLFGDLHLEEVKTEIKHKGKILNKTFVGNSALYSCVCSNCDYKWESSLSRIKRGSWCPACANKIPKTIKDAQDLAKNKNGQCLSKEYINSQSKMKWQCGDCDNIWETNYNSIQSGRWCPKCSIKRRAKNRKLSIKDYRLAAKKKGGKLLSTEYNNCYDKLTWQCGQGHIFTYRADQIKNTDRWCPKCNVSARTNENERKRK